MIVRTASKATLDVLTRVLIGASVLVGGGVAFLAVKTGLDFRAAHSLDADSKALEAEIKLHSQQAPSSHADAPPHPLGLAALRILQDAVTVSAASHQCQLSEFKAATQTAPYTPKYTKTVPAQPWTQMDAHFTISGRLRDVMEALRRLDAASVPVEVDAVNIAREQIHADGSSTVSAQVDLRALAQGAPS
ncbi:MAG: hypothetical protein ACYC96_05455 [Fimbriimonadaceae bacterium]